jgi:hypothetical protein
MPKVNVVVKLFLKQVFKYAIFYLVCYDNGKITGLLGFNSYIAGTFST